MEEPSKICHYKGRPGRGGQRGLGGPGTLKIQERVDFDGDTSGSTIHGYRQGSRKIKKGRNTVSSKGRIWRCYHSVQGSRL